MKKNYLFILSVLIVFCLVNTLTPITSGESKNLVKNSGFETVTGSGQPQDWRADFWQPGSLLTVTEKMVHSGKRAILLQADTENDIRMVQTFKVKGNTIYRFSGWVATENIPSGKRGATLCVMGGFIHSKGASGTTGWQKQSLVFRTYSGQKEVILGVRLGFFGETVTGRAYFDDLVLEQVSGGNVAYQQIERPTPNPPPAPEGSPASGSNQSGMLLVTLIIGFYLLSFSGLWFNPGKAYSLIPEEKYSIIKGPGLFMLFTLIAFLIRFPLYGEAPFPTDLGNFKGWAMRVAETGPVHFYAPDYYCDYPPFSLYIFWFLGWLIKVLAIGGNEFLVNFLIKLPSFICDVATAWLIYQLLKKKNGFLGMLLGVLYLFIPAILYNSSYWGQVDTYYALLMMLTFYLIIRKQPELAVICVAASFLTKAQTIAFLPLLLFYLFLNFEWKRWITTFVTGIITFVLIILPFNINQPWYWIYDLYTKQAALYPYASMNAANFITLIGGNYATDNIPVFFGLSYVAIGLLLFLASVGWSCYYYWAKRTRGSLAVAFTVIAFAFFMFFPRMHERYIFPVLAFLLLTIGYYKDKKLYYIHTILGISYLFNMHAVILKFKNLMVDPVYSRVLFILAIIHTCLFIALVLIFQLQLSGWGRNLKQRLREYSREFQNNLTAKLRAVPFKMEKRDYLAVGSIVLIYTLLIFFRLGSWSTPQKGMELNAPQLSMEVVFDRPVSLDSLVIYDAQGTGELMLEEQIDGAWVNPNSITCNDYFVMKRLPLSARNVERVRIRPNPSAGFVNEIAFFDEQRKLIPVKKIILLEDGLEYTAEEHPLFNEQQRMLVKPSPLTNTYFDEVYHGRTAYEFVTGTAVYETTHPPLGKDLLSLGILMFGMNPFGMRFIHALMGIFFIIMLFYLGREILATRFGAYCTMLLGVLDFMPFVQSRYATIDTTSVLFIGLMFLFAFKFIRQQEQGWELKKSLPTLAMVAISFGLGAAVKWTAVYGFAGVVFCMAVIVLKNLFFPSKETNQLSSNKGLKDKKYMAAQNSLFVRLKALGGWKVIGGVILIFIVLAPMIYYLSYIPFFNCKGIQETFSDSAVREVLLSQRDMYDYHSKLNATHPFSSPWWGWPFNFKPLWLYSGSEVGEGMKSTIVTMGNPLIWLAGTIALVIIFYRLLTIRRFTIIHLVFAGFLSLYLPWVLVSRIAYIYHYYPPLPLVLVLLAFSLEPFWKIGKSGKDLVVTFFCCALLLFVAFYPALTGLEVPITYIDRFLRWFPQDWIF